VTKPCHCVRCLGPLEPAQQFRFLVETDTLDNPVHLARIRALPSANGKPLPVCKACQTAIEATAGAAPQAIVKFAPKGSRQFPPELLGVIGLLSVGLLVSLFLPRV
jgi:hypothetical protein